MSQMQTKRITKYHRDFFRDVEKLSNAISKSSDPWLVNLLLNYKNQTRPYFVPRYFPQSVKNPARRKCNLIGGFPFTTSDYPWPVDVFTGQHLQPIAQIDLDETGTLLEENFASGLLQIWGYDNKVYGLKVDHRLIPKTELSKTADTFFSPNIAKAIEFEERILSKPQVSWVLATEMFMGTFDYVNSDPPDRDDVFSSFKFEDDDNSTRSKIDLESSTQESGKIIDGENYYEIIYALSNVPYFGTYLGGFGGGIGSRGEFLNIDPKNGRLLLRIGSSIDDGNIGVLAQKNENGILSFEIETCYL